MKAKNNVTNLHEPAADEAEVVYCCHEHWNNNPNTLAMHDGRWFTCSLAEGSPDTVPVCNCREVSLIEACRWFVGIDDFSEGGRGSTAPLLAAAVKELENRGAK